MKRSNCDIFCQVIDNYGDIGIAWRLARQLVSEHALKVRLWVTDLHAFNHLWPESLLEAEMQSCEGVEVRAWGKEFPIVSPAHIVIEAFGCNVPASYLAAMCTQSPPAVWINLEYLSAEAWVKTHHALPSPHPTLPLTRFFFFPGYEKGTGGVLCEQDLAHRRDRFHHTDLTAFWQSLGISAPSHDELRVSMFAYENSNLTDLLDTWAQGKQKITCLIPAGKIVPECAAWLGESALPVGTVWQRGRLELCILPFLNQNDYDRLLWACDINFVRGEDSCVRAQWAQKPFIWQPYPQDGHAEWGKLDALNGLYVEGLSPTETQAITKLWRAWNGRGNLASAWAGFVHVKTAMDAHAKRWTNRLAEPGDLASNLVAFVEAREAG